jgi:hypothetical protein
MEIYKKVSCNPKFSALKMLPALISKLSNRIIDFAEVKLT